MFLVNNRKKSAVKHSIENTILFNVVNLSPTFCPRLQEARFTEAKSMTNDYVGDTLKALMEAI